MAITEISRDWGKVPSIVRMVTTDNYETVVAPGYVATQLDNIRDINHGDFSWQNSDQVLVNTNNGRFLFEVSVSDAGVVQIFDPSSANIASFTKEADDAAAADDTDEIGVITHLGSVYINSVRFIPKRSFNC
jgi:hypothetical protein